MRRCKLGVAHRVESGQRENFGGRLFGVRLLEGGFLAYDVLAYGLFLPDHICRSGPGEGAAEEGDGEVRECEGGDKTERTRSHDGTPPHTSDKSTSKSTSDKSPAGGVIVGIVGEASAGENGGQVGREVGFPQTTRPTLRTATQSQLAPRAHLALALRAALGLGLCSGVCTGTREVVFEARRERRALLGPTLECGVERGAWSRDAEEGHAHSGAQHPAGSVMRETPPILLGTYRNLYTAPRLRAPSGQGGGGGGEGALSYRKLLSHFAVQLPLEVLEDARFRFLATRGRKSEEQVSRSAFLNESQGWPLCSSRL